MSSHFFGSAAACTLVSFMLSVGCASSTPRAEQPGSATSPRISAEPGETPPPADSLPRYFTVQLSKEEMSQGRALIDGRAFDGAELQRRLAEEAADGELQGAALIVGSGVSHRDVVRFFGQLRTAGFSHVLVSGAASPVPVLPAPDAPEEPVSSVENVSPSEVKKISPAETEATLVPEVPPVPVGVIVKNLGLHIGGGPNSTANKERFSGPISKRFDDFRRCHLFAKERGRNASFGVDFLVGSRGGRSKIKDYRTSLKGKDFHLCVLGVFGEIEFPAPPRPTVISYSLLFKRP